MRSSGRSGRGSPTTAPEWERPAVAWLDDNSPWRPAGSLRTFWRLYDHAADQGRRVDGWLAPARVRLIVAARCPAHGMIVRHGTDDFLRALAQCRVQSPSDGLTMWHGTTAARATSILRTGLKAVPTPDAYNPSGPGPFVANDPWPAFLFGCRAAARELHARGRLRKLPREVPVAVLTIQARASNLTACGTDEFQACGIEPWDVLTTHLIDARGWLERISPEDRVVEYTNADRLSAEQPRLVEEAVAATPDVGLLGIPSLPALLEAYVDAAGATARSPHHGIGHVAQVASYGLEIGEGDADLSVILLFAVLHDALRQSEGGDEGHGERAADLGREWNRSGVVCLSPARLEVLAAALAGHAHGWVSADPTVGACWDADRLALRRLGVMPDRRMLSTRRAQSVQSPGTPPQWGDVVGGYIRRSAAVEAAQPMSASGSLT